MALPDHTEVEKSIAEHRTSPHRLFGMATALIRPTKGVLLEPVTDRQVRTRDGHLEFDIPSEVIVFTVATVSIYMVTTWSQSNESV